MKALIVYATNSGGTRFASEFLASKLAEKNIEVVMQEAWEVEYKSFTDYDLVLFGTNTWFYNNKEGQPHKWYLDRQAEIEGTDLSKISCSIFALGDSSYAQFCHSADGLKNILSKTHANIIEPILKIDGYYRDEASSESILLDWLNNLLGLLEVK
jgi:flavodoxin